MPFIMSALQGMDLVDSTEVSILISSFKKSYPPSIIHPLGLDVTLVLGAS